MRMMKDPELLEFAKQARIDVSDGRQSCKSCSKT